ncbi:MAG: hypothetical protein SangKO_031950 [Sandaracinaceae bacterium]
MSASDAVVGHLGAPGSGKTWRLKWRVASAVRMGWHRGGGRIVVADVKREWPRGEVDPPRTPLTSGARVEMGRMTGRVPRVDAELPPLTICRPRTGASADEVRAWFDALCRFALDRRRVVLVAPEVWRYARESERMVPALEELAHEHRHRHVSLWFDTQDFASTKKELLKRAGWFMLHGTAAHEDLTYLRKLGGPQLPDAVQGAMHLNRERGAGHFVVFNTAHPLPPYQVIGPDGVTVVSPGRA